MASTQKHLRSSTAHKRPTTAIAEGQIALATNIASPGLFFKDSTGATIIKIGPVHVGATAPNVAPAGSAGNSIGEIWLDTSLTPVGVKVYNGSSFVNATPIGSTTVQGLLELATNAETQAGADSARAITSAGLQSKLSDSISTTSSTTIASATAVKSAYDLANAALPKTGGTITGNLEIGTTGSLSFEGATADAFETTIAVVDPTADRTITLPDTTGTIVTTGDTGTITSTMLLNGTILNADINASAGIVDTKLATISTAGKVSNSATTATNANTASAIVARDASGNFSAGTITATLNGNASTVTTNANLTGDVTSTGNATSIAPGVIVDADVNASAAIAGTKINPNFGSQNITTTGTNTAASFIPTSSTVPTNGVYRPAANSIAISTNGTGRLTIDSSGDINIDSGTVYVDAVNNRLGIGTTSPTGKLHAFVDADGDFAFSGSSPLSPGAQSGFIGLIPDGTNGNAFRWGGSGTNRSVLRFLSVNDIERARFDSSGRFLIGAQIARANFNNSNSSAFIQLEGDVNSESGIAIIQNRNTNTLGSRLILAKNNSNTISTNVLVANEDRIGAVSFQGNDGTEFVEAALISVDIDGTPGANDMPGRLMFSTTADGAPSPTERMRIDSAGIIQMGDPANYPQTTGYGSAFAVLGTPGATARTALFQRAQTTSSVSVQGYYNPNGLVGTISLSGSATSYNTSSDYRLKENVTSVTDGITRLQQLKPSRFNFIADPTKTVDGFLAHEVQDIVPEAITGEKDAVDENGDPVYQGIDQSKMVPLVVAALQECLKKVEALEAEVASLKA
jgi:hypothetical protein